LCGPSCSPTQGGLSLESCDQPLHFYLLKTAQVEQIQSHRILPENACITVFPRRWSSSQMYCRRRQCLPLTQRATLLRWGVNHVVGIWRVSRGLLCTELHCATGCFGRTVWCGCFFLLCSRRPGRAVLEEPSLSPDAGRTSSLAGSRVNPTPSFQAADAPKRVLSSVSSFRSRRNSHSSVIRLPAH
jgi:hypothetical protein